jgi:hypothetical protein
LVFEIFWGASSFIGWVAGFKDAVSSGGCIWTSSADLRSPRRAHFEGCFGAGNCPAGLSLGQIPLAALPRWMGVGASVR